MRVLLAETFFDSLLKLPASERDRAIKSIQQLKKDPQHPSLNLHPVKESKNNFYTARISRDGRLVVHLNKGEILVCFAAKHDDAYNLARNRFIRNTKEGSEIVSLVERTETSTVYEPAFNPPEKVDKQISDNIDASENLSTESNNDAKPLFSNFSDDLLLKCGVDEKSLERVRALKTEQQLFLFENQISINTHDNLIALYLGEDIPYPKSDAEQRTFEEEIKYVEYEDTEEILAALKKPWERWLVFLSGAQKQIVSANFNGPCKVFGGAGTGKTVVALHRAKHFVENAELSTKRGVGLLTFSRVLSNDLKDKADLLIGSNTPKRQKLHISHLDVLAQEILERDAGKRPQLTTAYTIKTKLTAFHKKFKLENEFTAEFVISEFMNVVGPWGLWEFDDYKNFQRKGRQTPLSVRQRKTLLDVYNEFRSSCEEDGLITSFELYQKASKIAAGRSPEFDHVIIDETQDLGPSILNFVRNLVPKGANDIMLCGDSGQSLYTRHHSFRQHGFNVQGRSKKLRINYRTSKQIKELADKVNDFLLDLNDSETENRRSLSIFEGPNPQIELFADRKTELQKVSNWVRVQLENGMRPHEIIIVSPNHVTLEAAHNAISEIGVKCWKLDATANFLHGEVGFATAKRIKGLEYRCVAIIGCDETEFPNERGLLELGDRADYAEYLLLEKNSLYVAMTRARDKLFISGIQPGSEYLNELLL